MMFESWNVRESVNIIYKGVIMMEVENLILSFDCDKIKFKIG